MIALGCGGGDGERASTPIDSMGPRRSFAFVTIEGARFDSATTRGRYTLLLFLTTYDLSCQLAARQLEDLYRTHIPRINVGAVVLEPPRNAPLVEAFAAALSLTYSVALADHETLHGGGGFGRISTIPTYIVLNPAGQETWRSTGWVDPEVIETQLPTSRGSQRRP